MPTKTLLGLAVHPDTEKLFENIGLRFLLTTESESGTGDPSKAADLASGNKSARRDRVAQDWSETAFGCGSRPAHNSIGVIVEDDISRLCTERHSSRIISNNAPVRTRRTDTSDINSPRIPDHFIPLQGTPRRPYIGSSWLNGNSHPSMSRQSTPRFTDEPFPNNRTTLPHEFPSKDGNIQKNPSPAESGMHSQRWQNPVNSSIPEPKPPLASVSLERANKSPAWDQVIMFGEDGSERNAQGHGANFTKESFGPSVPAALHRGGFAGTYA